MLLTGFGELGQPWRVLTALVELGRGKLEMRRSDQLIGEGLLVWTDPAPRRRDPSAPYWTTAAGGPVASTNGTATNGRSRVGHRAAPRLSRPG
jgi:hypothetical protein